jgi:hypothetical protein
MNQNQSGPSYSIWYHHYSCEFASRSWRGVLDTTLCDQVCQWLATGWWFSPGTSLSSTNKPTYSHDITEILLKMCFNEMKWNQYSTSITQLGRSYISVVSGFCHLPLLCSEVWTLKWFALMWLFVFTILMCIYNQIPTWYLSWAAWL